MPPSSIDTRSSWSAACATSFLPTPVEPVKVSLRSRGSRDQRLAHLAGVGRGDDVEHAGGQADLLEQGGQRQHASAASRAAGLTTIVQPAAMAGPILRVPIASGKFHGVIISVGPTGRFIVISRVLPAGAVE